MSSNATSARQAGDPSRLSRWRVWQRLAVGSGTVVYEAADGRGVTAALKTVAPGGNAKDVARRLHREAELLRRAGVSGVVRLREDGSEAPVPYLALELVSGPTLRDLVGRRGPLNAAQTAVLGALLADTVGRVHRRGVVHGDLKPANILCPDEGPLLIDFDAASRFAVGALPQPNARAAAPSAVPAGPVRPDGVVRPGAPRPVAPVAPPRSVAGAPVAGAPVDPDATAPMPRPGVGAVLRASPRWLAPEQALDGAVDGAADVFALGALVVFLCTGRSPFGEGTVSDVVARIVAGDAELDAVPTALLPMVQACLRPRPADRPTAFGLARLLLPQRRWPAAA